jgi:DNA/RNA-binding domain of Phe-tRNA-synthetase-like protein
VSELAYSIAPEVFTRFPDYVRGVVVARDVRNGESSPELVGMLREAEGFVREQLGSTDPTAHPRISAWREAFRSLGIKPSEYRSSVEALARRALRNQTLPSINALVDVGNVLSLRHLVPVGGHAIDEVTGDLALRFATGGETFVPFGSNQPEHPLPGEIVFVEGDTVLTRRWTWRQANHTLTLPTTTAIEFNVDGLPPVSRSEVEKICEELTGMVTRFCGGRLDCQLLSRETPRMTLRG